MPSRPPERAVALVVVGLGALVAAGSSRPLLPAFLPIGDHATYSAVAPRALVWLEPVLHAPWLGAPPMPVAALLAGAVLLLLWLATRYLRVGPAVAAVIALAWIARPDVGGPWASGAPGPIAVALVWMSLLLVSPASNASGVALSSRVRLGAWLAALVLGLACVVWPPVIVLAPVVLAVSLAAGPGVVMLALLAALAGAAAGLQWWTWRAAALAGESVSWRDAWAVVVSVAPRGHDPFPWPPMAASALPLALAVVGGSAVLRGTSRRWSWLTGLVASVLIAAAPHAWRLEASRALYWASWPLAGAGLAWLMTQASARARPWVVLVVAGVLIGGGLSARVRLVETAEARTFAASLRTALEPLVASGATMVTEDTRVDTALVAWDGGARLTRVRPVPDLVAAALASGRPVLAGPAGRSALELWGFRFAPGAAVTAPAPYAVALTTGRFRCVPVDARWNELAGLEYTGRLGVHVPQGSAQLELVVAGAAPLVVRAFLGDGRPVGQFTTETGTTLSRLPPVLWPGDGRLPDADAVMTRIVLPAHAGYDLDGSVLLGARAPLVGARVTGGAGAVTVCAAPLPRLDPFDVAAGGPAAVAVDDDAFFAGGWHQAEGSGATVFRWTSARAVLLVPSSRARAVTVTIAARAAVPGATLRLVANGAMLDDRAVAGETHDVAWDVPAALWVDGTNELGFAVSRTVRPSDNGGQDARELGVAVSAIRLSTPVQTNGGGTGVPPPSR